MFPLLRRSPSAQVLTAALILLFGGIASVYQVAGSMLFHCGRAGAGMEMWYWTIAVGIQSLAFLWSGWSPLGKRLYRLSQWAAMPLIAFVLYQLSAVHARPMLLMGIGIAAYVLLARALDRRREADTEPDWSRLGLEGMLFVLAVVVIQAALAFLVLYSRGLLLNDRNFGVLLAISFGLAFFIVRRGTHAGGTKLHEVPPLFLLVMILLRAKLPDAAYDALFYKATLPVMIADWRTALTGLPDHTLLGTNLQEILNAQLRILDDSYAPSFLTTLAFFGIWAVVPAAARACANILPVETASRNLGLTLSATALLLVSLSEPLTTAGSSYQEPLLILLMAAGLIAGPAGWLFLAAAAAVKITALFFLPLLLLVRAAGVDRERVRVWLETPYAKLRDRFRSMRAGRAASVKPYAAPKKPGARLVLVVCGALAILVFGEQLARNQLLAGRLLVPSEMLAGVTDPDGRFMSRVVRDGTFDVVSTRSSVDSVVGTLIHMGTLNLWMETDEHGFHVLPSSRLPLVAMFLALLALWCARKKETRPWALATLLFAVLFVCYLQFFSQGRHMAAASFAALVVVAAAPAFLWKGEMPRWLLAVLSLVIGFLALGDQLVGNMINVGWDCTRRLSAPAVPPIAPVAREAMPELDRKLADIVAAYRAKAPLRHDVIPTVLCDQYRERKPYFGAHYAYSAATQSLLRRYFSADPARFQRLERSALVVCAAKWDLIAVRSEAQSGFRFLERVDDTDIYVSQFLLDGGPAVQLVPSGFPVPESFRRYVVARDFGAAWKTARLADPSPKDTPSGAAALEMSVAGVMAPVLVAPNALIFDDVEVRPGDRIRVDAALPLGKSDGLQVELRLTLDGAAPLVKRYRLRPKRFAAALGPWRTEDLAVPDGFSGKATLTVKVSSEGGDPDADWIAFRELQLQRRAQ